MVEVECDAYDGRVVRALTLEARGSALHPDSRAVAPSARYVELLRDGERNRMWCRGIHSMYQGTGGAAAG